LNNLKFSVIIPIFNRPDETEELLTSLSKQRYRNFEVIIVEDGSEQKSDSVVQRYQQLIDISYFFKENSGPGDSRNFGAHKATGDYLVFFDSDCVIPADYFMKVSEHLANNPLDVYGGPDKVPEGVGNVQKAINYAMTSLLTTGGIRGHKDFNQKFVPRSFNMGVSRKCFLNSGGFSDIHPGEDPELVYRLMAQKATKGLIPDAYVFHKRRIDFIKFAGQVYKFGLVRTILMKWHPRSRKLVFALPTIAIITGILFILLGVWHSIFWWVVLLGLVIIFCDALIRTRSLVASILAIAATVIQVSAYGLGFGKGWWYLFVLKRPEQSSFPYLFKKS